jgi:hypothetical protein
VGLLFRMLINSEYVFVLFQALQKKVAEMELEADRTEHQISDLVSNSNKLKLDLESAGARLEEKEKLLKVGRVWLLCSTQADVK